ncbi:MAG: serine/threonine protein phosphatase [Sphingobium sp.]|nr:serine/threonine protein phosphatase [Sphingobium sp.]
MPRTADGERFYVIGDVHGRFDLLCTLIQNIEDHEAALSAAGSVSGGVQLVLLGDLIDRGNDSARVIECLYNIQRSTDRLTVLMGNHEEMMLRALSGEAGVYRAWMRFGGDATVRSFGLEPPGPDDDYEAHARLFAERIPQEWVEWVADLPWFLASGDYFFCHAGVRPGIALQHQSKEDLLWIRDEFLNDQSDHGAIIVHGHSIVQDVEVRRNRIAIDTGAYRSDVLTALYLDGDRCEFLSTGASSAP